MTFAPNPKQSLLLWRMLTAETQAEREPGWSKAKPDTTSTERQQLVEHGYAVTEKRGRGKHLLLTDQAWAWASETADVTFSRSAESTAVLEGLLHRLIPFLERNDLALASLFMDASGDTATAVIPAVKAQSVQTTTDSTEIRKLVESVCLELTHGERKQRVPLAALRSRLSHVPRAALDQELITLQRELKLVLYREDNSAALTAADHAAALIVGDSPRHLVIWEN